MLKVEKIEGISRRPMFEWSFFTKHEGAYLRGITLREEPEKLLPGCGEYIDVDEFADSVLQDSGYDAVLVTRFDSPRPIEGDAGDHTAVNMISTFHYLR